MKQKIIADVRKGKDKTLQDSVWKKAGKDCPFRTNRGFDYHDEKCLECPKQEQCQLDTQRRLLSILHGFQNRPLPWLLEWDDQEIYGATTEGEYLEAGRDNLDEWWFNEKRESIRQTANAIIKRRENPEDCIHPNTRQYFQNCFPEWNKYEEQWIDNEQYESMEAFYEWERERCFTYRYNYLPADYELAPDYDGFEAEYIDGEEFAADREEILISSGDWRGFPFESVWNKDDNIPRRVIRQFAQDYFSYRQHKLNAEKESKWTLELFGKQKKTERWPRGWMMENKTIKKFIESRKGKFFIELLKYLESTRMKMAEGEQVAKKLKHGGKKFVCVQVDRKKAAEYLSRRSELQGIAISADKVYRFLKWMSDHGLIKRLGKPAPRANSVYAIGKWFSFPDPTTGEMRPGGIGLFVQENNKEKLLNMIQSRI